MPAQLIFTSYSHSINEALKEEGTQWLLNLNDLSKNEDLYKLLSDEQKVAISKYIDDFLE